MNEKITQIREALGLTKVELAKGLGYSSGNSFVDIEKGRSNVSEQLIKLLVLIYNVNENWLRYDEGEMFTEKREEEPEWHKKFVKLEPEQQLAIMHTMDTFIKSNARAEYAENSLNRQKL